MVRIAAVSRTVLLAGALVAGGVWGGLTACSGGSRSAGTQPALIPSATSPIADVPVPAGFVMTTDSTSQVIPGSGLRFVDHRYKGDDDVLPVVRFFREQMPRQGWTLIDQNQIHAEITLHFSKNNEDALITVYPGTFDTHIRVRIDPSGRNAAVK